MAHAQSLNMAFMYEQARAPISNAGLQDGYGFSSTLYFPSLNLQDERSLVTVQPGMLFDFLSHGKAENTIPMQDVYGITQNVRIKNSSFTGGIAMRFALSERFAVRPYLNSELAMRTQRTYESWPHQDEDDCPIEETIERSWAPAFGMGGGVMVRLSPMMNLDMGVTWRQSGRQDVVPLTSVGETEKGAGAYTYEVNQARGQFLGFRVGINMLLDDCGPGCDHSSCCAPSRHSLE